MMVSREQLSEIGLDGKRADVYLSLLRIGTGTAMEVAKAAKVKRPTAYDILDDLADKHLVTIGFKGKRRIFSAENPIRLKENIELQLSHISALLPDLQALHNIRPNTPRIRYYEGVEGIKAVSEDILTVITREYFYFGSMKEIIDVTGKEYQRDWVRRRIEKKIWSNAIRIREKETSDNFLKDGPANLRRLRFFPRVIPEDIVSLYIYDNKVTITSAIKECYGMIIESRELVTLMKALWQMVWSVAEPA
jgi:HTH-type transcriptional regulator, sugar sensing transcriptional regulator